MCVTRVQMHIYMRKLYVKFRWQVFWLFWLGIFISERFLLKLRFTIWENLHLGNIANHTIHMTYVSSWYPLIWGVKILHYYFMLHMKPEHIIWGYKCVVNIATCLVTRLESIMLQNLLIMVFSISPIFSLLCWFLCFLGMHYANNLYL